MNCGCFWLFPNLRLIYFFIGILSDIVRYSATGIQIVSVTGFIIYTGFSEFMEQIIISVIRYLIALLNKSGFDLLNYSSDFVALSTTTNVPSFIVANLSIIV